MTSLIEFIKMSKNPRVGLKNAWAIREQLCAKKNDIRLDPTAYYDNLYLRANCADLIVFDQVFISLSYGGLENMLPIKTVVDAGANIGLASVFFTKRLGQPSIVALEPEEKNVDQAILNTKYLNNVEIIMGALWHKSEVVKISNLESSGALGFQVESAAIQTDGVGGVQGYTVVDIMDTRGWEFLDLLKIDIEGAEKELFQNANAINWMKRVRIIVIELHDWLKPGCSSSFFKAMASMDNIEMSLSGENLIIVNRDLVLRP